MQDIVIRLIFVAVLIVQLLLWRLSSKKWLKWLPVMIIGGLMAGCWLAYMLSDYKNWGFLVLLLLLFVLLVADLLVCLAAFAWNWLAPRK